MKDLFEDITLFSNRTVSATALKRPDGKYEVSINVETRKFKADGKGNETEVPADDWVDIGAFAKTADGKQYGDTLYRARVHITGRNSTFTFTTAGLPEKAGTDPFALLIDPGSRGQVKKCGAGVRARPSQEELDHEQTDLDTIAIFPFGRRQPPKIPP